MKLLRFGELGREKPGILDRSGQIRDLSHVIEDFADEALGPESLSRIKALDLGALPLVEGSPRIGAPMGIVPKFLGIGLNYRDHAEETGMPIPEAPIVFAKASSCLSGPYDPVLQPKGFNHMDFEVELAVVIGSRAKNVAKEEALDFVAGYSICNDVSERSLQKGGAGEWIKAKSYDSFGPLGPWLVTKDEIKDPQGLNMWLDVNGEKRQRGNTKTMIFDCRHLVWYCSQFFVLEPGDVIITGTPPGVGLGMKPEPKFLKAGDVVTLGIDGLGEQRQKVVKFKK